MVPVGTLLCACDNKIHMANYITADKQGTVENRGVSLSLLGLTSITCFISSHLMNSVEKYFVSHIALLLGDAQGYPDCTDLGNGYG